MPHYLILNARSLFLFWQFVADLASVSFCHEILAGLASVVRGFHSASPVPCKCNQICAGRSKDGQLAAVGELAGNGLVMAGTEQGNQTRQSQLCLVISGRRRRWTCAASPGCATGRDEISPGGTGIRSVAQDGSEDACVRGFTGSVVATLYDLDNVATGCRRKPGGAAHNSSTVVHSNPTTSSAATGG